MEGRNGFDLPFVLAGCLMEDVLLAVDSKNTILHDTLPIYREQ